MKVKGQDPEVGVPRIVGAKAYPGTALHCES